MDNWCISLCLGLSHLSVSYPQRFLVVSARGAFGLSYPEQIMCAAVLVGCYRGLARWIQPWGSVGARKFRMVWSFFHVSSLRITCSRLKIHGTGRWDSFSDGLLFRGELVHVSFIEGITITSWKHGVNSCQEVFQQKGAVSTRWGPTIVVNGVIYNLYKWPKTNGFAWNDFTLLIRLATPFITGITGTGPLCTL